MGDISKGNAWHSAQQGRLERVSTGSLKHTRSQDTQARRAVRCCEAGAEFKQRLQPRMASPGGGLAGLIGKIGNWADDEDEQTTGKLAGGCAWLPTVVVGPAIVLLHLLVPSSSCTCSYYYLSSINRGVQHLRGPQASSACISAPAIFSRALLLVLRSPAGRGAFHPREQV